MKYREFQPSSRVGALIKCYWTLEDGDDTSRDAEPIIPDGCPEIVFNLNQPFKRIEDGELEIQPKSIVVGQMKSAVSIKATGSIRIFGVRFLPYGLSPVLNDNADQLTGKIESVDSVFGQRGVLLDEQMSSTMDVRKKIEIFERTFEKEISASRGVCAEILGALEMIQQNPSGVRISEVSNATGLSVKQLERRFRWEIGLTPKVFARIARIQKLLGRFQSFCVPNWTEICYANGFSDQSHMIREFKAIAGASPETFVQQKKPISDLFIG